METSSLIIVANKPKGAKILSKKNENVPNHFELNIILQSQFRIQLSQWRSLRVATAKAHLKMKKLLTLISVYFYSFKSF